MGLYAVFGLQDVGVDGALRQEADLVANLACLLLKHADELGTDDLALCLGLGDVNQLAKEAIGRVHIDQVRVHLILEHVDDLLAFTLAHEAVVHVHADELLTDCLDEKGRDDRAVNAAGKSQQNLLVTDLLADCGNLLVDERLGKLGGGDAGRWKATPLTPNSRSFACKGLYERQVFRYVSYDCGAGVH